MMVFKIEHHNKISFILNQLNTSIFEDNFAYFGGGTLIALQYEEYRKSNDIDFICPINLSGYKQLRTIIFEEGYQALFSNMDHISIGRATTDQYGIRLLLEVDNSLIKMEIIAEGRFILGKPEYFSWSSIPCLNFDDCCTAKLLANADRFMDDSVKSRDLIDLAMLRSQSSFNQGAISKAENAYEVIRPLKIAIKRFQERENYREKCFQNLEIQKINISLGMRI